MRLAEEVTEPATFVATQVYTPLFSIDTPRMRRAASPVSLQKETRRETSPLNHTLWVAHDANCAVAFYISVMLLGLSLSLLSNVRYSFK